MFNHKGRRNHKKIFQPDSGKSSVVIASAKRLSETSAYNAENESKHTSSPASYRQAGAPNV